MSYISSDDLVFNNKDGIYSGGFNVQSIMLKGGISPILTLNKNMDEQTGGNPNKVSDLFGGLVVPAYAYYNDFQSGGGKREYKMHESDDSEDDIIDDDLHDKLLDLMKTQEPSSKQNKKKSTRKQVLNHKSIGTKHTLKNKNKE